MTYKRVVFAVIVPFPGTVVLLEVVVVVVFAGRVEFDDEVEFDGRVELVEVVVFDEVVVLVELLGGGIVVPLFGITTV